nr:DUF899 family protein [Fodinibius saliphilus]
MVRFHERTFPGETKEYRQQRDQLLEAEIALRKQLEEVARRRRVLPRGGAVPESYIFEEGAADLAD